MVRTRRSKEIEEEQVHDDSGNAQASSGSDSDDAPEEVSLAHSKTNALRERKQERLVQREQKQKDKEKRNKRLQAAQAEKKKDLPPSEEGLDLLPDTVLDAIRPRHDDDDEGDEGDEEEDRRVVERRIVSEQLRHGIMQGKKKKKFQDKTVGPVRVTTLTAHSYSSSAGCEEAKAFLQKKLGQRHKRSYSGGSSFGPKRHAYTYF
ncbi:hypothetical protein M9435_000983 [Picochlorum sp. BPE23]|nr:hypothetical protein M9435_000983 [Picochlorum sp. BPE23]